MNSYPLSDGELETKKMYSIYDPSVNQVGKMTHGNGSGVVYQHN